MLKLLWYSCFISDRETHETMALNDALVMNINMTESCSRKHPLLHAVLVTWLLSWTRPNLRRKRLQDFLGRSQASVFVSSPADNVALVGCVLGSIRVEEDVTNFC